MATTTQQNILPPLTHALTRRLEAFPPVLSISQLAGCLQRKVATVRKQHARGVLGIPIFEKPGLGQYALLNDVELFLRGGHRAFEVQKDKRRPGRPSNAAKAAIRQHGGMA